MDLLIVPFYNISFVYTWNDFSWLIMYDYTVWIVFYYLFALSENDEIEMINQWNIKSKAVHTRITQKKK